MDTGPARPPLPSYTAITPVTRAPDRNEPAAQTELPVTSTVTPATEDDESRRAAEHDTRYEPPLESLKPELDRETIIDPESDSVVFIATDSESGEVVYQIPIETLRKLRAYARSMSEQANEQTSKGIERTA